MYAESIKRLYQLGGPDRAFALNDDDCDAILDAIEAMERLQQGASPNTPLTLEELRGMDGEPVWCVSVDDKGGGEWYFYNFACDVLFDRHEETSLPVDAVRTGKVLAYRRKLEEEPI